MPARLLLRLRQPFLGLVSRAAAFGAERSGVAAVEFALVLPVMTVLFFGLAEVGTAVAIDRKVTLLARSLADLSSRDNEQTTDTLKAVFAASSAIMRPYDDSIKNKTQMVISSVVVTQSGSTYTGAIAWSCGRNINANTETDPTKKAAFAAANLSVRQSGASYAVPAGFQSSTTKSFILAETLFPYDSSVAIFFKATKRLSEEMPWPVRNGDKVAGPSTANCPPNK